MKRIRFIMQGCGQTGIDAFKDFYCTEIVEVSDRAYELLTSGPTSGVGLTFMSAESLENDPVKKGE